MFLQTTASRGQQFLNSSLASIQTLKELLSEHFAENHMTVTNGCKIMVP